MLTIILKASEGFLPDALRDPVLTQSGQTDPPPGDEPHPAGLRKDKTCPGCGRTYPGVARFCNHCGIGLDRETPREEARLSLPRTEAAAAASAATPSQAINSLVLLDRTASVPEPAVKGWLVNGRYRLEGVAGRGGMGVVYRAADLRENRAVAVKLLLPQLMNEPGIVRRFREQVAPLSRLEHRSILPILDAGQWEDMAFLVTPFMAAGTLRAWIAARRVGHRSREDLVRVVGWAVQVAGGLAYAHRAVVHRDLKPENILIDGDGFARIADFDLAKFRRPSALTLTGQTMGTAYYMAPEQARDPSRVDGRADLFSLGVVLYEAIAGELPVGAFRSLKRRVRGVPAAIDAIVNRLMAPFPAHRYPDAESAARALAEVLPALAKSRARGAGADGAEGTRLLSRLADRFLQGWH